MSDDEFDKEAERERLREKYGDDGGGNDTRRMSELLLKGATMTNRHCETCGDPIFRQNGQEFCPTCNAEAQAEQAEGQQADAGTNGAGGEQAEQPTADGQPARGQAGQPQGTQPTQTGQPQAGQPAQGTDERAQPQDGQRSEPPQQRGGSPQRTEMAASQPGWSEEQTATAGDLAGASETLVRAVTRHAEAGAETSDPRRAKAHFAAAREAAETLAALRR